MSPTSVDNSARNLRDIATNIVWRQWRAIGGSATSNDTWHSIVDPETLVLASLGLVDHEPRIHDVMTSWVESHADLLSAQRLKNLQKAYPRTSDSSVTEFARRARSLSGHPRWNTLSNNVDAATPVLPDVRRATRVAPESAASLLLRLRMAFGVGVKADLLSVLLGSTQPLSIRDLSSIMAYTPVATRSAMRDLSGAGFVTAVPGPPSTYAVPHDQWRGLLGLKSPPRWVTWHHWFALVIDFMSWCDATRDSEIGAYAIDVKVRELFARHEAFFRFARRELDTEAHQRTVGSYPEVLGALLSWARREATTDEASLKPRERSTPRAK